MAFGPKVCASCGSCEEVQEHHLVPHAHYGIDLPTVWLCNHCHSVSVHRKKLVPHHAELTRFGLEKARARGVKLGNPALRPGSAELTVAANAARAGRAKAFAEQIYDLVCQARSDGSVSLRAIARWLDRRGVPTSTGSASGWSATQVQRVILANESRERAL